MSGETRQSLSQVDATFAKLLGELQAQAEVQLLAITQGADRNWFVPGKFADTLLDPVTLAGPGNDQGGQFQRTNINQQYANVTASYADAGTVGDVVALKLQNDYVAMMERAWRVRHTSLLRSQALAGARDFGQSKGPIFTSNSGGIVATVSDFIAAGASA